MLALVTRTEHPGAKKETVTYTPGAPSIVLLLVLKKEGARVWMMPS